ncbi:MAG TPA: hypothetical protein VEX43_16810 [Chthoniobacterales bacterium]|nr:hypothetical protein [Chthoniobacterales bacterium]
MASDSDLFQKRVLWGFGKTYSQACGGANATELAPSILRAIKNMLKGEFRCPALNALISCVADFVDQSRGGLFAPQKADEAEFRDRLTAIERTFADYESTHVARQALEGTAIDLARASGGEVEGACCERFARLLFDRYCVAPTECNIRRARQFSRAELHQYNDEAFAAVKAPLIELLREVAHSPAGIPSTKKKQTAVSVNTAQGLEQPLGVFQ